jgi:hypothetical protein
LAYFAEDELEHAEVELTPLTVRIWTLAKHNACFTFNIGKLAEIAAKDIGCWRT